MFVKRKLNSLSSPPWLELATGGVESGGLVAGGIMYKYFACIRASAGKGIAESDVRRMKQPWFNLLVSSLAFGVG